MNTIKYTETQEKELTEGYCACNTHDEREDFILKYMHKHSKSKSSVISKLSKMRNALGEIIYIKRPKVSKVTGGKPETKEQMLQKVASLLGINVEKLEGIDKGPKLSLLNLYEAIVNYRD